MGKIKLTTVPFQGTEAQEKELRAKLADIKKLPGALMPALQAAQGVYGYLPVEVQQIVAEELNVKEVEFVADETELCDVSYKANFKTLGKKCGPKMKAVAAAIAARFAERTSA